MKWSAELKTPKHMRFVIEQQKLASLIAGKPDHMAYYLYVWENGKGIRDDLQDSLEAAQRVVQKMFQVPLEAWKQEA